MTEEEQYSEKIALSYQGIRLAVLEENGSIAHYDNWSLEPFGGALPSPGDHLSLLWDAEYPSEDECYVVVSRHWIGEFKGDNCWWLLLKAVLPTKEQRHLFRIARGQSSETRALSLRSPMRPTAQELLAQKIKERQAAGKPVARRSKGKPPSSRL